ncbi:MAG TPA: hypothetical protein VII79_09500, partial [Candidatus Dormibacteraeota bacterium]
MTVAGHPILGLLVDGEPHPNARGLLVELRRWCIPRQTDPASDPAPAWLALSSRAPGLDAASRSGSPLAVWVENAAEADAAARLHPALLLT